MPYGECKGDWLALFEDVAGRRVSGLSGLTLAERHSVITHLQGRGARIFAPAVPEGVRDWRKGDPDVDYEFREGDSPQIRMICAVWAELGYRQKSLRGLVQRRFGKDDIRWLSDGELNQLANLVAARARARGVGHYYRRSPQRHREPGNRRAGEHWKLEC